MEQLELKFGDIVLEDSLQLDEYKIDGSSKLELVPKIVQKAVKCYDAKNLTWTLVALDDSINTYKKLKELVSEKIRQSVEEFTIFEIAGKRFT